MKNQKKKLKKQVYHNVATSDASDDTKAIDEEDSVEGNSKKVEEFILDEIAWKKVKGDVFRRPKCSLMFSVLVGTGVQIFSMTFFLLIFAVIGLISPAHRGAIMSALYFIFIILSNVSGYYAARFYKMF
jgi:transmembrane 9 superfamily protein 2/4